MDNLRERLAGVEGLHKASKINAQIVQPTPCEPIRRRERPGRIVQPFRAQPQGDYTMTIELGRCPSGRAAAADAVEPSCTVSSKAGIPNAGLYIYSTLVSRHGPAIGQLCTSMVQGYRYANSEDEARGMAVAYTTAAKPDFGIDQVLVLRVTDDEVLSCASAIEARRAAATEIDAVHESAVAESQTPNSSRTTP